MVVKRLAYEFQDSENGRDTRVQVRHLLSLPNETVTNVKSFYLRDDVSRMATGKRLSNCKKQKWETKATEKGYVHKHKGSTFYVQGGEPNSENWDIKVC